MSRPPTLSLAQREDITRRVASGETIREVAQIYGISHQTVLRWSDHRQAGIIRTTAERLASVESEIATLGLSDQITVRTLAEKMKTASRYLADAAVSGAQTSARLADLARGKAQRLRADCTAEDVRPIAALQATSSEAARTGMELIRAHTSGKAKLELEERPPFTPAQLRAMAGELDG